MKIQPGLMIVTATCVLATASLTAPEDRFQGGSFDGWDRDGMTNSMGMSYTLVTMSSGTDQAFDWTQSPAILSALTITVENPGSILTNTGMLCVGLPASFEFRFDTNSTVTYSGSAAGKVGAASFSNTGQVVRIPVTSNFAMADDLMISGLALAELRMARPVTDRLALDVDGNGTWDVVDSQTLEVRVPWPGGSYDGWAGDGMRLYAALLFRGTFFSAQ